MRTLRAAWVAAAASSLVAVGCGGGAGTSPSEPEAGGGEPPCTASAILAGVKRQGETPVKEVVDQRCSGDWATAAVNTAGKNGITYTAVLRWDDGAWLAVDREEPCEEKLVPDDIYEQACETN